MVIMFARVENEMTCGKVSKRSLIFLQSPRSEDGSSTHLVLVGGTVGDDTAMLCSSFSSKTRHLVIVHPLVSEFVAYTKNDPGPQQYIFMASLLSVWNEIPR